MLEDSTSGTIETVEEDIGKQPADKVRRWKSELKLAEKAVDKWHKRGEEVIRRYRDEEESKHSRFNVLWANTETMKPAIYNQPPIPDVRRRITDQRNPDPVGREAAMVLERALSFSIDDYDFDGVIRQVVEDYLLPGRGLARVRYVPTMVMGEPPRLPVETAEQEFDEFGVPSPQRFFLDGAEVEQGQVLLDEQGSYMLGEAQEEVVYEEARCEYVYWQDYLEAPARTWEEVRWVSFRSRLSRKELREQFPKKAADVTLDWMPKGMEGERDESDFFKKATIYEIWDKDTKKVIIIATGYEEGPLAEWDDPLELDGFYPHPRPLDFITTNDSRVPVPLYKIYQDQASELDVVTQRINKLITMLKVRGVYDKVEASLESILKQDDGVLIGIDNFAELSEKGGLDRVISFLPIEQIAKVLQALYLQREQIKRTIHEITGLSDIIRGSTDPRETKGAQQLKADFGTLRLQNPQRQVQRFVRDLLRLKAEIMSEHFGEETLRQVSGIVLPSDEEKAQAQANPQDKQAAEILRKPTWAQVMELLRDDGARGFRIDIETDSTIQIDASKAKAESIEMIQAISTFIKEGGAVAQQSPALAPLMMQLLKLGLRQFKPGRLVEESLDQTMAQLEQGGQQPSEQDKKAKEQQVKDQAEQAKAQAKQQEDQAKMQVQQAKLQLDQQEMQMKAQSEQAKLKLDQQEMATDANMDERKLSLEERKLVFEKQKHTDEMTFRGQEGDHKAAMERGKMEMEQEKLMGEFGPNIIEALERAQANMADGSRVTHEAILEASQQNSQALAGAMQALVGATEALVGAIETISGPKRIVRDKKGVPVGIEPGRPEGVRLQ